MNQPDNNIAVCRPPRDICRDFLFVAGIVLGLCSPIDLFAEEPVPGSLLTGPRFRQALDQPLSGSWTNIALRQLLKEVANERRISIVLDRRLDPSAELPIDVTNVPLRAGLIGIAKQAEGDASFVENSVFLGPKSATKQLRTLIELRSAELQLKETGVPRKRRSELGEHRTFHWEDLETPGEILDRITRQAGLKMTNPQAIPHDLWAETTLPLVTATEALSVILIQFELTFRWTDEGAGVEFIPIPDRVSLERKYRSKQKTADAIASIRQRFPRVQAELANSEIVVTGSLEEHEAISQLLRGNGAIVPIKIETPKPIRERIFLLKAERVPVKALMKKLEESAISFEYDANELQAAGIDLDQAVNIDVKNVSAVDFFKAVFNPIGLDFDIDHLTVTLKPRKNG